MSLTFDHAQGAALSRPTSTLSGQVSLSNKQQGTAMAHSAPMSENLGSSSQRSHDAEKRLCNRITLVSALILMPIVIMRRLLGQRPAVSMSGERLSILAEARADASAVIPYIFMG